MTGVSCVGKTTIGKKMGELLGVRFFDLDNEIESFFETSIERLQDRFLTIHSFRNEAAKALVHLLNCPESRDCVIALPLSGLMGGLPAGNKESQWNHCSGYRQAGKHPGEDQVLRYRLPPDREEANPQGEEIVSERD